MVVNQELNYRWEQTLQLTVIRIQMMEQNLLFPIVT